MHCGSKNQWGLFGSLYFAGMVVGTLIQPRLSDLYGRKPFAIGSALLHSLMVLTMVMTSSYKLAQVLVFVQGFCMPGRVFVGYAFMIGHMADSDVPMTTVFLLVCDASTVLVASLYFQFISKDWRWLLIASMVSLVITSICYCMQSEAPKFYYGLGQFEKAREVLTAIGRSNKILSADQKFELQFQEEHEKKVKGM